MTPRLRVRPLLDGPILPAEPPQSGHQNINGPSLIRVPAWVDRPLGRYYLYFASHKGARIELAYADALAGPWRVHEGGALHLRDTPFLQAPPPAPDGLDISKLSAPRARDVPSRLADATLPHIASPEAVVDATSRSVRLYYHGLDAFGVQPTRVAVSNDGVHFTSRSEILAPPYLRMFRYAGAWYGIAMPGGMVRSASGLSAFEFGPGLFESDMRHAGIWLREHELWVFWTRVGDAPERILLSTIDLRGDWSQWRASAETEVRRPQEPWEGADLPVEPSVRSSIDRRVNQLRDPTVYTEGDATYLVYAIAGESGLAIARIEER